MPSEEHTVGVAKDLGEKISALGYDIIELAGPIEITDADSEEATQRYYLTASLEGAQFYILLSPQKEFGEVIYPYSIATHLSGQIARDDVEMILGEIPEWDNLDEEAQGELYQKAGKQIIENTPLDDVAHGKFNLARYASSPLVEYRSGLGENGFPIDIQCSRGIFPFTEPLTLKEIDDRIVPVISAGNRVAAYVENAFNVEQAQEAPSEYTLSVRF